MTRRYRRSARGDVVVTTLLAASLAARWPSGCTSCCAAGRSTRSTARACWPAPPRSPARARSTCPRSGASGRARCLRARNGAQWDAVLELPHALAGDRDGAAVAALPPQEPAARGTLLAKLQAMSGELAAPAARASAPPGAVTYVLNPDAPMSSGKTIAQIAHAAVLADEDAWSAAGCPGIVVAPGPEGFATAERSERCVARVVDAGLTELPPGTLTVLAL